MNLAYKYPIIFWNTANLIVDSAGIQESDDVDEDEGFEVELEEPEEEMVSIYEPEDWEEYDYEDLPDRSAKKKKKAKSIDFGKIATAIGKFQLEGINITPPDINKSGFTFTPDVASNSISSGLRNITRISADLVSKIIENRPYTSVEDFLEKVKVNKTQMLNLLKCGAFDCVSPDRAKAIDDYIASIAGQKSNLTLSNVPALIKYGVLGEGTEEYCKLYTFNKCLRSHLNEDKTEITFPNEKTLEYYCENFDVDCLSSGNTISAKAWEKQYKKAITPLSDYIKEFKQDLLNDLNRKIVEEQLGVYAGGNLSKYEMESVSFYFHDHELKNIDKFLYGIVDYKKLPDDPEIEKSFKTKDNSEIKIYKLHHICGTVLSKNKIKGTVVLLTPSGIVNVKIYKNQFAKLDKQISQIGIDGKKHVIEKSWFSRGQLLYIQGFKRGDNFIPKAYKNSFHSNPIMKITKVDGANIYFTSMRSDEVSDEV